jgi:ribokinase
MITVFGSTNVDQTGRVGRLPRPGETVIGGGFAVSAGGKGANQALAARRAGARVRHVGAVGRDVFAQTALALLDADGVDLSRMRRVDGPSGIAMILVDAAGENVIAVMPGANARLGAADADAALADLAADDILLLQQEIPQEATGRALEIARACRAVSVLNTAPFLAETGALAARADVVISNETEFDLLAGGGSGGGSGDGSGGGGREARMRAMARDNGQTVIVTLGAEGALVATPDGLTVVPAPRIAPVDTVGAGDTFCGYLAAGLDAGLSVPAAARRAVAAASLACLKPGAQPAIPYARDLDAMTVAG